MRTKGTAFKLTGFILGVTGTAVSITAIVFSLIGFFMSKHGGK